MVEEMGGSRGAGLGDVFDCRNNASALECVPWATESKGFGRDLLDWPMAHGFSGLGGGVCRRALVREGDGAKATAAFEPMNAEE